MSNGICFLLGGFFGWLIAALCVAAKECDENETD